MKLNKNYYERPKLKDTEDVFHKLGIWQLKSTNSSLLHQSSVKKYATNGFWLPAEASVTLTCTARQLLTQCQYNISMIFQVTLKQLGYWPDSSFYLIKVKWKRKNHIG